MKNWQSDNQFIYIATYNGDAGIFEHTDEEYRRGCTLYNAGYTKYDDTFSNCYHLFATNINLTHDKCTVLPYGFTDKNLVLTKDKQVDKDILCYAAYTIQNCYQYRQPAYEFCINNSYITSEFGLPSDIAVQSYKNKLCRSKFCICPPGNGSDTYRFWEALYNKSIPIVLNWPIHRSFTDLPILIVNDWKDINEQLLNETYAKYQDIEWNYDKLSLKYYHRLFNDKLLQMTL